MESDIVTAIFSIDDEPLIKSDERAGPGGVGWFSLNVSAWDTGTASGEGIRRRLAEAVGHCGGGCEGLGYVKAPQADPASARRLSQF